MTGQEYIFVGGYGDANEPRIFRCRSEKDGAMLECCAALTGVENSSYLTRSFNGDYLYAVIESMSFEGQPGGGVAAIRCSDEGMQLINCAAAKGTLPCHVLLDEEKRLLYTANYMNGSLSLFRLSEDGGILELSDYKAHTGTGPNKERQEGPHVHFGGFAPDRSGAWFVDLGLDTALFYEVHGDTGKLVHMPERDIDFPKGTGPRHFVLHPHLPVMYVVSELSSEVFTVNISGEKPEIKQQLTTLPEEHGTSTCAAIKISPDGCFVYASNRGDDSVAVFAAGADGVLTPVEIKKTGGRTPRDILVLEDRLYSANQDDNCVTVLQRDRETGCLSEPEIAFSCPSPVCIIN